MAYSFARANSQYLEVQSAPVTTLPLTMCCWYQHWSLDISYFAAVMTLGTANGAPRYSMFLNSSGTNVSAIASSGPVAGIARSSAAPATAGTWAHAACVFSSTTSRTVYLNGGNTGTDTTSVTVNTPNNVLIGARYNTTIGAFYEGPLAEVGIWNAALTQPEIASLAKGATCNLVRPQSLVFYVPLIRDVQDRRGGLVLTNNNGATVANHPRLYL